MYLTRHQTYAGSRWAIDGAWLPAGISLSSLLALPRATMEALLQASTGGPGAEGDLLAPVDPQQEVWGSGVTYMRSREARKAESDTGDIYEKVYDAERPEIFFKSAGWRVAGHGRPVRIRADTTWNVPEPELTLVANAGGEIIGYAVGNDMSSRDIEGENPLYLPQAKTYDGSCAVGPGIRLLDTAALSNLDVSMEIERADAQIFSGETSTSNMKRSLDELIGYLYREMSFPHGAMLMTGTGIVPPDEFTLQSGDLVRISIDTLTLENVVA